MGYHIIDTEDEYWSFPDRHRKAVERTMEAVGVDRWGNETVHEIRDEGHEVVVKLQQGSGTEIDLTGRTFHSRGTGDIEMLHHNGMLHEGRVEKVLENGWLLVMVRARY